jgi:hypothetical protein
LPFLKAKNVVDEHPIGSGPCVSLQQLICLAKAQK